MQRKSIRIKKKKTKKKEKKEKRKKRARISRGNDKPTIRDVPEETINALGIHEKEARGGTEQGGGEGRAWVTAIEEARLTSVEKTRGSVFIK